jgi:hypothetical protein
MAAPCLSIFIEAKTCARDLKHLPDHGDLQTRVVRESMAVPVGLNDKIVSAPVLTAALHSAALHSFHLSNYAFIASSAAPE